MTPLLMRRHPHRFAVPQALASVVSGYALASGAQKQIDLSLWGADGWLRADVEHRHLEWQREAAGGREATRRRTRYV